MSPDLLQNDLYRQLNQFDSSTAVAKKRFPQLELIEGGKVLKKSESVARLSSKYETGVELTTNGELEQAGLNPKNVKHKFEKGEDGVTKESSTVKYPYGRE